MIEKLALLSLLISFAALLAAIILALIAIRPKVGNDWVVEDTNQTLWRMCRAAALVGVVAGVTAWVLA